MADINDVIGFLFRFDAVGRWTKNTHSGKVQLASSTSVLLLTADNCFKPQETIASHRTLAFLEPRTPGVVFEHGRHLLTVEPHPLPLKVCEHWTSCCKKEWVCALESSIKLVDVTNTGPRPNVFFASPIPEEVLSYIMDMHQHQQNKIIGRLNETAWQPTLLWQKLTYTLIEYVFRFRPTTRRHKLQSVWSFSYTQSG